MVWTTVIMIITGKLLTYKKNVWTKKKKMEIKTTVYEGASVLAMKVEW